jgi:hypothetical protein
MALVNMPPKTKLKYEHPLLAVRPREDKSGWYVEAWWTSRPSENIGHFATQSDARNWITLESTSYFVLREIETMIKHPNNRQADQRAAHFRGIIPYRLR